MIEDKKVVITKNTFLDKGWAAAAPFVMPYLRNNRFRPLSLYEVVRAVTYADTVNLILSEPCLSGQIVKELIWANRYCKINIIAKTQSVLDKYSKLNFTNRAINKEIDFNYIAIEGKINIYAFITDCCIAANERANAVYFKNSPVKIGLNLPANTKTVILTDEHNNRDYADIIALCKNRNISVMYIIGVNEFTEEAVCKFKKSGLILLCARKVHNGIIYITEDGAMFCVYEIGGEYVGSEIQSLEYYFDNPFKSLELPNTVEVKDIPPDSYLCVNGEIKQLHIEKTKVIERTVQIDSMADFLCEKFDRSEIELFNRYCTSAESVEYNFTLLPPILYSEEVSDIYDGVKRLYMRWLDIFKYPIEDFCAALGKLELQNNEIYFACKNIIKFDIAIRYAIDNLYFENFYSDTKSLYGIVDSALDKFTVCCEELFITANSENAEMKFDRIDNEISGYKRTIDRKKSLIAQGIDVLKNKRRIEILEKKIGELTELKQKFINETYVRDDKQAKMFSEFCKSLLNGTYKENTDSVGNIVSVKQNTKLTELTEFLKANLRDFYNFLVELKAVAEEFAKVDIPTEYIVYKQNGLRVIAIDSEREYYSTEAIQKKYSLHCVAVRDKRRLYLQLVNSIKKRTEIIGDKL